MMARGQLHLIFCRSHPCVFLGLASTHRYGFRRVVAVLVYQLGVYRSFVIDAVGYFAEIGLVAGMNVSYPLKVAWIWRNHMIDDRLSRLVGSLAVFPVLGFIVDGLLSQSQLACTSELFHLLPYGRPHLFRHPLLHLKQGIGRRSHLSFLGRSF